MSENSQNTNITGEINTDRQHEQFMRRKSRSLNSTDFQSSIDRGSERNSIVISDIVFIEIKKLIQQFPDPPIESIQIPVIPKTNNTQNPIPKVSNGWGSFRGIAEKFNMFK